MLKRARRRDALGHIGRHNRCKGHMGRERCRGCLPLHFADLPR